MKLIDYQILSYSCTLLLGTLFTHFSMKAKHKRQITVLSREKETAVNALTEQLRDDTVRRENLLKTINQLTTKQDVLERKLTQSEKNLAVEAKSNLDRTDFILELNRQLEKKENVLDDTRKKVAQQEVTIAEMKTQLSEERKQNEEKLTLLDKAKDDLRNQFKNLAQEIFEEKGQKFTEQNSSNLEVILAPFKDQLQEFRKKVNDVYVNDTRERASLKQELQNLRSLNQQINQEATNLTRALKGDKKKQGTWGELVLERVLEESGLRKGEEYETQGSFRDHDNKLLRPDVVIHLPENKDIIIDSKVSLAAYDRYCSSDDESQQAEALNEHAGAIRNHICMLSEKDYSTVKGVRSLDFVLMFVPIEPAFMAAFQHDDKLFSVALQNNIVVVTPTTMLATLRTIENIWRFERQNQNARIIFDKAGAVYDKLRGFLVDMEKLGKQLSATHTTYDKAMNKLTLGRGNLISQANSLVNLGVQVKKELPKSITEQAGLGEKISLPQLSSTTMSATDMANI